MNFNIFQPTPVIIRSDNGRISEDLPAIFADEIKEFPAIERGEVYALLPEIPTDLRGNSFLVVVKASSKTKFHPMTIGQAAVLIQVASNCHVDEEEVQAIGRSISQLGLSLQRCDTLLQKYHSYRLTNLCRYGYFNIEGKAVVSLGIKKALKEIFNYS